jgi:hypothetical protein
MVDYFASTLGRPNLKRYSTSAQRLGFSRRERNILKGAAATGARVRAAETPRKSGDKLPLVFDLGFPLEKTGKPLETQQILAVRLKNWG